jgi:hypothetical protein
MYALQICRSAAHTVAERLAGCRAHNVAAVGCLQSTSAVALHTSKVGAMPGGGQWRHALYLLHAVSVCVSCASEMLARPHTHNGISSGPPNCNAITEAAVHTPHTVIIFLVQSTEVLVAATAKAALSPPS